MEKGAYGELCLVMVEFIENELVGFFENMKCPVSKNVRILKVRPV